VACIGLRDVEHTFPNACCTGDVHSVIRAAHCDAGIHIHVTDVVVEQVSVLRHQVQVERRCGNGIQPDTASHEDSPAAVAGKRVHDHGIAIKSHAACNPRDGYAERDDVYNAIAKLDASGQLG